MSKTPSNIIGNKYNKLTVIAYAGQSKWLCKCDCGNETTVGTYKLKSGHTKSCGCVKEPHGQSRNPIYQTYHTMINRCYRKTQMHYENYGGKGITVCDEWLNDFKAFYNWAINNGYKKELTLDRINPGGNYEPSNCRWATIKEQNRNKKNTWKYKGVSVIELCEKLNISYSKVWQRVNKQKWSLEKALEVV